MLSMQIGRNIVIGMAKVVYVLAICLRGKFSGINKYLKYSLQEITKMLEKALKCCLLYICI